MQNLNDFIKNEANKCVKCGLCLPHCPTYSQSHHEGESPRGRIALLEGIACGELEITPQAKMYVDHCLGCGACEKVCPVPVHYEKLLAAGRAKLTQQLPDKISLRIILKKLILFILPRLHTFRQKYPVNSQTKIGIIPGCIHSFYEKKVFTDSLKILQYLNIAYQVINQFKCCGRLHQQAGDVQTADCLNIENQLLFKKFDLVLSTASGCSDILNYSPAATLQEITAYLKPLISSSTLTAGIIKNFNLKKILIHQPCSAKEKIFSELENCNLAQIIYLDHHFCCGGAGTYFLEYPDMAKKLALDIVTKVKLFSPDIFITNNIGCSIHLKRQFKKHGMGHIKIWHPVNFIAAALMI